MVLVRTALRVARRFFMSTSPRRCELQTGLKCPEVSLRFRALTFRDGSELESRIPKPTSGRLDRCTSWCPEVGLRFLDLTFCDRSEVESRIPKPTSGHLDRVTCWCPEVGLGIPNLTSGHLGSCRETFEFLVSRGCIISFT